MRFLRSWLAASAALGVCASTAQAQTPKKCPIESVKVGNVCIDKYEASVWQIPPKKTSLVKKVKAGRADLGDLQAGGATQISPSPSCSPVFPLTFPETGNWTDPLYAVSVAGVPPTACVTWFQAEQACALAGKRLVTNQEWQRAAAGTPDPGDSPGGSDCNTNSMGPTHTGSRANCVSSWGTFDMVGNVWEWVADWGGQATGCSAWSSTFGEDLTCIGGEPLPTHLPSALFRGGLWSNGTTAGNFAVDGLNDPSYASVGFGFRCAR